MATRVTSVLSKSFWSGWAFFGGLGDGGEQCRLDKTKVEIGDPLGHADIGVVRRARMGGRLAGFEAHIQRDDFVFGFTHVRRGTEKGTGYFSIPLFIF